MTSTAQTPDSTEVPAKPGASRPGGRSARIRSSVHRAVEELLSEGPADALTIPVIATRAGVHATTIYRRWGSLGDLLAAVAASSFTGDIVTPDTGSLRGDLDRWVSDVATDLKDPESIALMRAAVGTGGPDGCNACVDDRQSQLRAMIERDRARGNDTPEVEHAADMLLGPLYFQAIFRGRPAEPEWARSLVADLLG